ncbi:LOW QUALITY PROTEIN: fasciculation and elongation protein zeta-2 [Alosa sapidissima]|uniref:LOW QUALITY PROTEIN: fasciculation and elongation protein zeta-2 n=1 Tax=Alosa sapidissima TaxID=34773 RepID=UPI001C0893D2|nr:LOW QUALITY PROTEIN: fasciculation and elongation protein zeta-2 [Alosa sapidissima]
MAAPLAHFDDEWQDFNEFKTVSGKDHRLDRVNLNVQDVTGLLEDFPELDNGFSGEIGSFKSMEDLVNDFDEKLTVCFQNYNTKTENIAPVRPITEETILKNDEIWNALTDNYGNIMPVDWTQSRTRSLHLPTLNLDEESRVDNVNLDLSDDEELREQMDMHSIIVSCIHDEPLFTAEQVIEEIEEMMQDSLDLDAEQHPSQSDLSLLSLELHRSSTSHSYEERVRTLSLSELTELLEEVETAIRRYSEELVLQLALRDELDFEKEVKNSFISVLIDVQNRQKEHRELLRKKKKLKAAERRCDTASRADRTLGPGTRFSMEGISTAIQNGFRQTFGTGGGDKQYLTTVIPYERKGGPPSVEDLQILTKILQAMRDDSDKVPSLLTDYILKVLCPT